MAIKQKVAHGIIKSIKRFWEEEEQQDCVVITENVEIKCHGFLLSACSEFFKGLFRSGMKETEGKKVVLKNISPATFKLILAALYTGQDIITKDNVIEIWRASHQLIIGFIVEECEDFILKKLSVTTFADIHMHATLLDSARVLAATREMAQKNFDIFRKSQTFLNLAYEELLGMIKSHSLVVSSEDVVVESILKWVKYSPGTSSKGASDTPHSSRKSSVDSARGEFDLFSSGQEFATDAAIYDDRKVHLGKLMAAARLCLVSQDCLEMLLKSNVILDHEEARDIVCDAVLYQLRVGRRHGLWPPAAMHRGNSEFVNTAVTTSNGEILAFSLHKEEWYKINCGATAAVLEMAVFDNKIYIRNQDSIQLLKGNLWQQIMSVPGDANLLVSISDFMYLFHPTSRKILKIDPLRPELPALPVEDFPSENKISNITAYEKQILVFSTDAKDGTNETVVNSLDTTTGRWTRLNNLSGPADEMISFTDGASMYVLQRDGRLWQIMGEQGGSVDFEFMEKLWDDQYNLSGAVYYRGKLFIFGQQMTTVNPQVTPQTDPSASDPSTTGDDQVAEEPPCSAPHGITIRQLPGLFKRIQYIAASTPSLRFLPVIIRKDTLLPK